MLVKYTRDEMVFLDQNQGISLQDICSWVHEVGTHDMRSPADGFSSWQMCPNLMCCYRVCLPLGSQTGITCLWQVVVPVDADKAAFHRTFSGRWIPDLWCCRRSTLLVVLGSYGQCIMPCFACGNRMVCVDNY